MDGKGRVFDNIFSERLWRTVKVEEVYLQSSDQDIQQIAKADLVIAGSKFMLQQLLVNGLIAGVQSSQIL